jgi:hypothetical protein
MGGQLTYDALAYFAAGDPVLDGFEVDHWITCGSQVSLFAEMQLFLGQPQTQAGEKLPMPPRVAARLIDLVGDQSLAPPSRSVWPTLPVTSSVWLGSKGELRPLDTKAAP